MLPLAFGELERAVDERDRLVDLQLEEVREREALDDEHLEVLALGLARRLERRLRVALVRVRVALPGGHLREDPQRLESHTGRFVLEHLERSGREQARVGSVRLVLQHGLGECGERATLDNGLACLLGLLGDLVHLHHDGREVGEAPCGAAGEVAALERRRELDRAQEQLARAAERLARERAMAGLRQHDGGLLA